MRSRPLLGYVWRRADDDGDDELVVELDIRGVALVLLTADVHRDVGLRLAEPADALVIEPHSPLVKSWPRVGNVLSAGLGVDDAGLVVGVER